MHVRAPTQQCLHHLPRNQRLAPRSSRQVMKPDKQARRRNAKLHKRVKQHSKSQQRSKNPKRYCAPLHSVYRTSWALPVRTPVKKCSWWFEQRP